MSIARVYEIRCDECGRRGPVLSDPYRLEELAESLDWETVVDGDSDPVHICPNHAE